MTPSSTIPKVEKYANSGRYWREENANQAFGSQLCCLRSAKGYPAVVGVDAEGIGELGTLDSMLAILALG
jgi:hypothetical protein